MRENADGLKHEKGNIMKKSVLFKRIVLVLMLVAVLALVSCGFRGCLYQDNHNNNAELDYFDILEEILLTVEECYVDEDGYVSPEKVTELVDVVFEQVQHSENVSYCEKNDFSVYIILDNGWGYYYEAPIEDIASTGDEIAIYTFQPAYNEFTSKDNYLGNNPNEGVISLADLDITSSSATTLYNANVTIESLKNWTGDSVIVWIGHGGYTEYDHAVLKIDVLATDELLNSPEYADDFATRRLVTSNKGYVMVSSSFFEEYIDNGALENSIIYLGACYTGKDDVLAQTLISKGASAVYVNSDTIHIRYNNKMCKTVMESLANGLTVDESLMKAKDMHGEKDYDLLDLFNNQIEWFQNDTEVFYIGDGSLTLNEIYKIKNGSKGLEYTLNSDGLSYSVTGIGTCTDTDIVIPKIYDGLPVTSIGAEAFNNCTLLTSVVIGDSVTSIGRQAFNNCTSLTSIVIGESVTSIGVSAFHCCKSLTNVVMGDSVTSIDAYAFYWCESLTSIEIPASVTSIDDLAFTYLTSLTSIEVDTNNQKYKSINGNLYTNDGKTLIQYAIGKEATTFTVPDSVTSIAREAFRYSTSLTSIVIGDSVTSIASAAFCDCTSLTNVVIPDSVTSIGAYAFSDCTSLTIYCEAESQPSGWSSSWNYSNRPVVWGYTGN